MPRNPKSSPNRLDSQLAEEVIRIRKKYPYWGARKIKAILEREGLKSIAASTIHGVLQKEGFIIKRNRVKIIISVLNMRNLIIYGKWF